MELVRLDGEVERQLPVSREPLDPGTGAVGLRAQAFVPACCGLRLDLLEQGASSIEVPRPARRLLSDTRWALVVLQLECQPLLDLDAALDETGSGVAGTALCYRNVSDGDGDQCGVTYALGLLESRAGIDERRVDVCLEDPDPAPVRRGSAPVGSRPRRHWRAPRPGARSSSAGRL